MRQDHDIHVGLSQTNKFTHMEVRIVAAIGIDLRGTWE